MNTEAKMEKITRLICDLRKAEETHIYYLISMTTIEIMKSIDKL